MVPLGEETPHLRSSAPDMRAPRLICFLEAPNTSFVPRRRLPLSPSATSSTTRPLARRPKLKIAYRPGGSSTFQISTMLWRICFSMASFLSSMGLYQLEVWLNVRATGKAVRLLRPQPTRANQHRRHHRRRRTAPALRSFFSLCPCQPRYEWEAWCWCSPTTTSPRACPAASATLLGKPVVPRDLLPPLLDRAHRAAGRDREHATMQWLDAQPPGSVLYVVLTRTSSSQWGIDRPIGENSFMPIKAISLLRILSFYWFSPGSFRSLLNMLQIITEPG